MYGPKYEKKGDSMKLEVENSIHKLEQILPELNDLAQKCGDSITKARQILSVLERQVALMEKSAQEHSKSASKREKLSILIVEDEFNIRELLKDFVSSRGCAAVLAEDGHEAILAFQKQHFDMVFLDLRLPRISGVEVLKRIKEISPDTPVVVVTGNSEELQSVQDRSLRPQWVIPKPFKLHQIGEALNMIASR